METYTSVIIGAGSIGALKPDKYDSIEKEEVLTHAHAYTKHPRTTLLGIIDTDANKREEAAAKWHTKAFPSISSFCHAVKAPCHIVSICTPTDLHLETVVKSLQLNPKLIIIEKPMGNSSEEAVEITKICDKAGVKIAVNYSRRYELSTRIVKEDIENNRLGTIYSCVVHYDRGFKRDASHAFDLCRYWFGEVLEGQILPGTATADYSQDDLSYPVFAAFEKCGNVVFLPSNGGNYSVFDITMMTGIGKLQYAEHGTKMLFYKKMPEPTYGDYDTLSPDPLKFKTQLTQALTHMLDNVVFHLDNGSPLLCTEEDAMAFHNFYNYIQTRCLGNPVIREIIA